MFKKMFATLALLCFAVVASATTVPGEGAFCLANCVNGVCVPIVATVGQTNLTIGAPLLVYVAVPGGGKFEAAYTYFWAMTETPDGTPPDYSSFGSDTTNALTIATVTQQNQGMYLEEGFATGGDALLNWCITVNP